MGKLDGRVAIVTGSSRGIGEEIAKLFAREGARVVCAARTLNEGDHRMLAGSLAGTVKQITDAGGQAIAVAVDVSNEADCQKLVKAAEDAFGAADIRSTMRRSPITSPSSITTSNTGSKHSRSMCMALSCCRNWYCPT